MFECCASRHPLSRTVPLKDVKLPSSPLFSLPLILHRLTPAVLLNLAHLAGLLEEQHCLPHIVKLVHAGGGSPTNGGQVGPSLSQSLCVCVFVFLCTLVELYMLLWG